VSVRTKKLTLKARQRLQIGPAGNVTATPLLTNACSLS